MSLSDNYRAYLKSSYELKEKAEVLVKKANEKLKSDPPSVIPFRMVALEEAQKAYMEAVKLIKELEENPYGL